MKDLSERDTFTGIEDFAAESGEVTDEALPGSTSATFPRIVLFRSVRNDLPLILCVLTIGAIFGRLAFAYKAQLDPFLGNESTAVVAIILALIVGSLCALVAFRRYNVRYVIADDGVKALRGVLSNHQVDTRLEYYQIRGQEIHRSLFQRMLGTGDLLVLGATGLDTEVAFKGIHDPYRFQKLIQSRHRLEVQGQKMAGSNELEYKDPQRPQMDLLH